MDLRAKMAVNSKNNLKNGFLTLKLANLNYLYVFLGKMVEKLDKKKILVLISIFFAYFMLISIFYAN